MKVVAILVAYFLAIVVADKILGERTDRNYPLNYKKTVAALQDTPVHFLIALKMRNLDILDKTFNEVSNPNHAKYRQFMSIADILSIVAPPYQDVSKVLAWLRKHGANSITNWGHALEVKTTVAVAEKLFSTKFFNYEHTTTGRKLTRVFGTYSVPNPVSNLIDFVEGISNFPIEKKVKKMSPKPLSPQELVAICPESVNILYHIPSGTQVTGNSSIGVIEFVDQYYSPADLAAFATSFDVTIPPLTSNHVIGTNQPGMPQIEATLDIQYALGVAINAQGWFWIEPDNVWLFGFGTHMFGTQTVPLVNSISYDWNEEDQCEQGIGYQECRKLGVDSKGYAGRVNTLFQMIGLRGVTLTSASGDSGVNGRTDEFCSEPHFNPDFPGCSPYLLSVGGTEISTQSGVSNLPSPPPGCSRYACASGGTEQAVSFGQSHYASGGGFSNVASRPSWQTAAVTSYLSSGVALPPNTLYNGSSRAYPDVAGLGSYVLIETRNYIEPVAGTSCASPIFAAILALLNDYVNTKTGKPLGFVNPLIYQMAAEHPAAFTDITVGDNICTEDGCQSSCKGFYCTKGWDPVTGWGTPIYTEMLAYIQGKLRIR